MMPTSGLTNGVKQVIIEVIIWVVGLQRGTFTTYNDANMHRRSHEATLARNNPRTRLSMVCTVSIRENSVDLTFIIVEQWDFINPFRSAVPIWGQII